MIVARYTYDSEGRLIAAVDADGKAIETIHDTANNTQVVKDRRGNATTYTYDAAGNISRKVDALGNITSYAYDALGNEIATTDANGKITTRAFDPVTGKQLIERDPLGNTVTNSYDPNDKTLLKSVTDARGNVTTYEYFGRTPNVFTEPLGRVTSGNYNNTTGNLTSLSAAGQTTSYGYDVKGNRTSETDALGNQTTYTFDANGNETGRSWKRTVAGVQQTVSATRKVDESGRVIEETDPLGAKRAVTYNAASQPASTIDVLGRQTSYEYDAQARLIKTTYPDGTVESIAYDAEGNRIAHTDREARTTRYEYDALNRQAKTILPDGGVMETIYDAVGRVWKTKDGLGRETVNGYDDAGRLTSVTDPSGAVSRYEYDANGNRTKKTDARGAVTDYEYDALNRLVKTTLPALPTGGVRPVATTVWRTDGRKDFEVDANGNQTNYGYDGVGRLKTVTRTANGVSQVTTYAYDEVGNKTTVIDAELRQTKWDFDLASRPIKRTLPLGQSESHTYDFAGNITATTDFLGRVTRYAYDENNRLTLKALPDGTRMVIAYTPSGQVRTVSVSGNTSNAGLRNGVTRYRYDAADRLVRQDNADGTFLSYAYDANGKRTELSTSRGTTRYAYDANGRLIAVTAINGETTRYGYDASGNRIVTTLPNNTRTVREYDAGNRVTQIVHVRLPSEANPNSALLLGLKYTLRSGGQKAKVEEYGPDAQVTLSGAAGAGQAGGMGPATLAAAITGAPSRTVAWSYDAADRLVQEQVTELVGGAPTVTRTTSYTYDKVGNRKTKTETTTGPSTVTTYTYDVNDRLAQEVSSSGATSVTIVYGWDAAGNLASKTEGALHTSYLYDAEDRLIEVKRGPSAATAQTVATYGYDGTGNRIAKTVNGQTTTFLVDSNQSFAQVMEETASTGETTIYTRGAGLIGQSSSAGSAYVYADHLGSTRLITDTQGAATATLAYEAFGQVAAQTGTPGTNFRFAGEYADAETGFYYLRARLIDPAIGRFTTPDTFAGIPTDPPSLHKYLYAHADPVNRVDPSGEFSLGDVGAGMNMMMNMAVRSVNIGFKVVRVRSLQLMVKIQRFFWDPRKWDTISRAYWRQHGPANGQSLHHWLFRQSNMSIPEGIRNAGFNLLRMPKLINFPGGLNTWLGFAARWGGIEAFEAMVIENAIRAGIIGAVTVGNYISYQFFAFAIGWATEELNEAGE
jgi:RHS repeat-associated protein